MRRCEDEKMFYRPPLLEEPCAQTLSGKIRDLNGLRDPSFPLHLVKEKMCYLDVFGLNLDWWPHFVSPYAPSGHALLHHVSPGCGRRTQRKPTWNPTSLTFGGPSSSKFTKKCNVCLSFAPCCSFHLFFSLLISVIVSCRLFFLSSLSGFLPVAAYFGRLRDENGTQHISKNKSRPFLGGVLVSVLSPRQTWNLNSFQNVSATRNEN